MQALYYARVRLNERRRRQNFAFEDSTEKHNTLRYEPVSLKLYTSSATLSIGDASLPADPNLSAQPLILYSSEFDGAMG